uniref:Complement C3/4/5 macroglobulin domain-containing protein n=1 Tax=Pavo cristatus TaxID=9049 RepID=A0A8C9EJ87_PAVCR
MVRLITVLFGSRRQYVLMVPAVLQSDSPSQVCLQFFNLNQTISVRVVLESVPQSRVKFTSGLTSSPCFSVSSQIPPVISVPLAFISFTAKGTTFDVKERRSVMIWNLESFVFVQTDKPIYKPGQSGEYLFSL